MKLRVAHRTVYSYADAVSTSHHEAHLSPRESPFQRVHSHQVTITPSPGWQRDRIDYFGNGALVFGVHEPHERLEVLAVSVVDVQAPPAPDLAASPSWETARDRLVGDLTPAGLFAFGLSFDSPHARRSAEVVAYGSSSFAPGRPVLEAVRELTSRIRKDFVYDPAATDVSTPVAEVFERRRGVCQDFAHLQIVCLRAMGLSARYVSGYLLTHPPPGRPRLVGADASHAWVSVFVPNASGAGGGWVDFDPTNDLIPGDEHVTVACGRDFGDVTPLKGVILGGGRHALDVAVDVEPIT